MFNLNLLWVFYQVALNQGVGKGAKKLFVSQSAASQNLKQLEDVYGVSLAQRSRKGFQLTEEGEKLFATLTPLFGSLEQSLLEIGPKPDIPRGNLVLGGGLGLGVGFFIPHIQKLKKLYPQLNIQLYLETDAFILFDMLKEGKADIVHTAEILIPAGSKFASLVLPLDADYQLFGATKYLKDKPFKKIDDIFNLPFIDLNPEKPVYKWFTQYFMAGKKAFREYVYLNTGIQEAVLAGLGISIAPRYYFEKELKAGMVKALFPKQLTVPRKDCFCCLAIKQNQTNTKAVFDYFQKAFT